MLAVSLCCGVGGEWGYMIVQHLDDFVVFPDNQLHILTLIVVIFKPIHLLVEIDFERRVSSKSETG